MFLRAVNWMFLLIDIRRIKILMIQNKGYNHKDYKQPLYKGIKIVTWAYKPLANYIASLLSRKGLHSALYWSDPQVWLVGGSCFSSSTVNTPCTRNLCTLVPLWSPLWILAVAQPTCLHQCYKRRHRNDDPFLVV